MFYGVKVFMVNSQNFEKNIKALKESCVNKPSTVDIADSLKVVEEKAADFSQRISFPDDALADKWAANFKTQVFDRTYYLVGFSDGAFIRKLLKVTNNTNIIVIYEPDLENFMYVMNNLDVSDVLSSERVYILAEGVNSDAAFDVISSSVNYSNYKLIMVGALPGYDAYKTSVDSIRSMLKYSVELIQYEKLTDITLGSISRENELRNLYDAYTQRSIAQLKAAFKNVDTDKFSAIIVSAGPSLDKNIWELKRAANKAFIIVVDTALKAALRAGIRPDLTICIDPRKEIVFFRHEEVKHVPAIFAVDIPSDIIRDHEGVRFYYGDSGEAMFNLFAEKYGKEKYFGLSAGGSVANVAFSVAKMLGFKRIILTGQDLAFTDGRGHTKDAYDDEEKNHNDVKNFDNQMVEVEGIYGGTVYTEPRMKSYIDWFEQNIAASPDIDCIDATEGGALIHGSRVLKLSETIDEYCKSEFDFEKMLNEIPPLYSEAEQDEIKQYLFSIEEQLDGIAEKFAEGIKVYEKLDLALKSGNNPEIQNCMQKITPIISFADTEPLMSIILKYCIEDKYRSKDELYRSRSGDTDVLVREGIALLQSYINGTKAMKEQLYLMYDNI